MDSMLKEICVGEGGGGGGAARFDSFDSLRYRRDHLSFSPPYGRVVHQTLAKATK